MGHQILHPVGEVIKCCKIFALFDGLSEDLEAFCHVPMDQPPSLALDDENVQVSETSLPDGVTGAKVCQELFLFCFLGHYPLFLIREELLHTLSKRADNEAVTILEDYENMEKEALWNATKEKYRSLFEFVKNMRVRQKRNIFFILRQCADLSTDTFLPSYGLHCGEFACFQILAEHSRKDSKAEAAADVVVS